MDSTYNKPFLSLDRQLGRIIDRGMEVKDRSRAIELLRAIGYYRLSGYWYPFRERPVVQGEPRPSEFVSGTSLDEVMEMYNFDERLRSSLLRAIAKIEIAVRFSVGHVLGKRGPFAHMDPTQLDPSWVKANERSCVCPRCLGDCARWESEHDRWATKQRRVEKISSEAFVAHIYENYGEPLPVWTATETMTFEALNRLYGGMEVQDREQVAADFDVVREDGNGDAATFANWLEHLRQSRNVCAHHARLWNRNHTVPLAVSKSSVELGHLLSPNEDDSGARKVSRSSSRTYGTLALVAYLLARIDYSNEVRDELISLVNEFAQDKPDRLKSMGFPQGWQSLSVWASDYEVSAEVKARAMLLRQVELLYTKDAAARLEKKTTEQERRSLLGYYRKQGALLSVPGTDAHRYPSFQFDPGTGDVKDIVIRANRRLLNGGTLDADQRWKALDWWLTPSAVLGYATSPIEAVKIGSLTVGKLDSLLSPREDE